LALKVPSFLEQVQPQLAIELMPQPRLVLQLELIFRLIAQRLIEMTHRFMQQPVQQVVLRQLEPQQ